MFMWTAEVWSLVEEDCLPPYKTGGCPPPADLPKAHDCTCCLGQLDSLSTKRPIHDFKFDGADNRYRG
ncbi:hypothetical protein PSHT_04460 [Puccinia striiformis]|uniref:Uncharacterized protein n=1 Tax=Puccinia striiformis TaxID=27350 RepID=A0A2S4WD14_9BASI|nr:hypothetical protein PSHT_04460 [Puccinia striiformis]